MIDTDKYEGMAYDNWKTSGIVLEIAVQDLLAEVKRLRLLFRELIKDMGADDYIEWCNKIGCPNGLEVEAIE